MFAGRGDAHVEDAWDNDVVALASRTVAGAIRRIQQIYTTASFSAGAETSIGPPGTLFDVSKTYLVSVYMSGGVVAAARVISTTELGISSLVGSPTTYTVSLYIIEVY